MTEPITQIAGCCTDIDDAPAPGLTVRAFVRQPDRPDRLLGETRSAEDGRYSIGLRPEALAELRDPGHFLFIRASQGDNVIGESDLTPTGTGDLMIDLALDVRPSRPAPGTTPRRVHGTVRDAMDRPLTGVTVRALDRDVRTETLLGSAPTVDGRYEIRYFPNRLRRRAKRGADLVISVVDRGGTELHRTPVQFRIAGDLEVDISLRDTGYRGPSTWEVRSRRLGELLEDIPPSEVRESDEFGEISFLAGETEWSRWEVATMIACHRLSAKAAQLARYVTPEVFYAFLAKGQPGLFQVTFEEDFRSTERLELLDQRLLKGVVELGAAQQRNVIAEALAENLIAADVNRELDTTLATFDELRRYFLAEGRAGAGRATISELIDLVPAAARHQNELISSLSNHVGAPQALWRNLIERRVLPEDTVREVQSTFELAAMTRNHLPLIAELTERQRRGDAQSLRDFATLSRADWVNLLTERRGTAAPIGVPDGVDGDTPDQRAEAFAARLVWSFERKFPTTAFAGNLHRAVRAGTELPRANGAVAQFLVDNPEFQLDRNRIDHYLVDHPQMQDRVEGDPQLRSDLMTLQRVFRLHPTYAATEALLSRGFESAQQIYAEGPQRFATAMADTGVNVMDAQKIFRRAEASYATALTLFGEFNATLNGLTPAAVPTLTMSDEQAQRIRELPNLQTLFGSQDFCECAHCQSVYSPAAHFVDMLRFLDQRATGVDPNTTCLQVLFARRPDLGEIELSCANTDTALPYIDLVNEILEQAVAPEDASVEIDPDDFAVGPVTVGLREALAAQGFSVDKNAVVEKAPIPDQWILRDSAGALTLIDVGTNTGGPMGAVLQELMIRTRKQSFGTAEDLRAAPEHVNAAAYKSLSAVVFPLQLPLNVWDLDARAHLAHLGVPLARLLELFQARDSSGVSTPSDAAIAHARVGVLERALFRPADDPDTDNAPPQWEYWGLVETGNVVPHPDEPGNSDRNVTGTWIEVLGSVSVFLHRSALTYTELRQLLDLRFINPTGAIGIADNPSCDTSVSRINGWDGDALMRANGFVRLWRAIGCRMWELDQLLAPAAAGAPSHIDESMVTALSDRMRIRQRTDLPWDVVASLYNGLTATNYRDRADNDAPLPGVYERTFRSEAGLAKVFPPKPEDLTGIVGENAAAMMAALQLTETELGETLLGLGLDLTTNLNAATLHRMFASTTLAKAARLSPGDMARLTLLTAAEPWKDPQATLALLDIVDELSVLGLTVAELHELLTPPTDLQVRAADREVSQLITALRDGYAKVVDSNIQPDSENRDESTEEFAAAQARAAAQRQLFVIEAVASAMGLDAATAKPLLQASAADGEPTLLAVFDGVLASTENPPAPDSDTIAAVGKAIRRLRKAAVLITRLSLRPADVTLWLKGDNAQAMAWPRPLQFPAATSEPAVPFPSWLNLQRFFAWRASLRPSTQTTAFDLLEALVKAQPAVDQVTETLATLTGSPAEDIDTLLTTFGWMNSATAPDRLPTTLRDAANLTRLSRCLAALRRLGVNAKRSNFWVVGIGADGATQKVAADITQVARARYAPPQWRLVSQPIQDNLRETKRRALVNWLVTHPDTETGRISHDSEGLYNHFLIDVEMSACMLTSRQVQATASVQLFVQRCMLGLEPAVRVDVDKDPRWNQWQWLKNYRVWEANRKVFLYPENWIEPELRDEKSQFFVELEHELLQSDVTVDTVEHAYAAYLAKLDTVANLEIRATVREHINPAGSVLHIVGRARSDSSADHYYRRNINEGRWTPWERIDLDIGSDHVAAAVQNKRLYLVWPQFVERSQAPGQIVAAQPGDAVSTRQDSNWEVRLFYSERKGSRWSPKVLANTVFQAPGSWVDGDLSQFALRLSVDNGLRVALSHTPNANTLASSASSGFHKLAHQVNTFWVDEGFNYFPPLGARFVNNLIRQNNQLQFWLARRPIVNPEFVPPVTADVTRLLVFKNLPDGWSYTVVDSDVADMAGRGSFFVWDWHRAYYGQYQKNTTTYYDSSAHRPITDEEWHFWFKPHYHPFVGVFAEALAARGVAGLLNRQIQLQPVDQSQLVDFAATYEPMTREDIEQSDFGLSGAVKSIVLGAPENEDDPGSYPVEDVDFSYEGAYSPYNWELFFHVPFLIANKLVDNQQFEAALQWFHYIFDPIGGDTLAIEPNAAKPTAQQRFWITKPFFLRSTAEYQASRIAAILAGAAQNDPELLKQVQEWRDNPFNPHLIARMRTVAYQKNVVMEYIRMLIAWGDNLFARDTMESINEATQLYILASSILGRRPRQVPSAKPRPVRTFNELVATGLAQADPLIEVENLLPDVPPGTGTDPSTPALPALNLLYFGLPHNEKLTALWDLVEDRLFKVRNCMNLAGMVRQVPLFSPPIDPALLVKATAAGLSIADALAETDAPLPSHRFTMGMQLARATVEEVKALGAALTSTLEKRDAEGLAILRGNLEQTLRQYVLQIRQDQIDEAVRTTESLTEQRKVVQARLDHYTALISNGLNVREKDALELTETAMGRLTAASVLAGLTGAMGLVPEFTGGAVGAFGSPAALIGFGGPQLAAGMQAATNVAHGLKELAQMSSQRATTVGGYLRREEDWNLQKTLAERELAQIDKQLLAAEIRHQVAVKEHASHQIQIDNNKAETEYLQTKFTNTELYDWMVGQTSFVYFQSYQLALDLAKRAERSFRFELGLADSNYVQAGQWDSLRKGLLAGDKLSHDLRRLEAAYQAENRREFELTKHISLAQLDPVALLALQRNGECEFDVPEVAFDLDHPGHYFRRIKSVSLSIPCVVGPYTTIGARLTLRDGKIRVSPALVGAEGDTDRYSQRLDDDRFQFKQLGVVKAIATSAAQQDDGLFELDFSDPRYLPFEGAGAVSSWHIKLNNRPAMFDLTTITDVVIHMNYTARDGKDKLAEHASDHAHRVLGGEQAPGKPLFRVLDLRREYPDEWHRFVHADEAGIAAPSLTLADIGSRLPFFTRARTKTVRHVEVAALTTEDDNPEIVVTGLGADIALPLTESPFQGLRHGVVDGLQRPLDQTPVHVRGNAAALTELFLIIGYTVV